MLCLSSCSCSFQASIRSLLAAWIDCSSLASCSDAALIASLGCSDSLLSR